MNVTDIDEKLSQVQSDYSDIKSDIDDLLRALASATVPAPSRDLMPILEELLACLLMTTDRSTRLHWARADLENYIAIVHRQEREKKGR